MDSSGISSSITSTRRLRPAAYLETETLMGELVVSDRRREIVALMDLFIGGFGLLLCALALVGWSRGDMTWISVAVFLVFFFTNLGFGLAARRVRRPLRFEVVRIVAGALLAPSAYLLVDKDLKGWWAGFLLMCLGGSISVPLLTQRATLARILVGYYLVLYFVTTGLGGAYPNWYVVLTHGGIIAVVGLLYAQTMMLLGRSLKNERDRSIDLARARDALFAELEVAHEIQTLLLPRQPKLPGCIVYGHMLPATEVGGDYYDVVLFEGRSFLAIGDVSGHGVTSGLAMMMTRAHLLGALAANPTAPLAEIYRVVNRAFCQNLERMGVHMYMTFALVEVLSGGRCSVVGRHLPLMVYRRGARSVEEVEPQGIWLGVLDDIENSRLSEVEFKLDGGDMLVLYTDGIVEHTSGDQMYGFDRLKEFIRHNASSGVFELVNQLVHEMERFANAREDDMTVLVVEYLGDAPAPTTLPDGAAALPLRAPVDGPA